MEKQKKSSMQSIRVGELNPRLHIVLHEEKQWRKQHLEEEKLKIFSPTLDSIEPRSQGEICVRFFSYRILNFK